MNTDKMRSKYPLFANVAFCEPVPTFKQFCFALGLGVDFSSIQTRQHLSAAISKAQKGLDQKIKYDIARGDAFLLYLEIGGVETPEEPKPTIDGILGLASVGYEIKESEPSIFPAIDDITTDNRFNGAAICFTGFFPDDKVAIGAIVQKLNIAQKSGVSSKTQYLVTGSNAGPAKISKAAALGVTIIAIESFLQEITQKP